MAQTTHVTAHDPDRITHREARSYFFAFHSA